MSLKIPLKRLPGVSDPIIEKKVLDIGLEIQQDFYRMLNENMEYTRSHSPYDQEMREQGGILMGDVDLLVKSWEGANDEIYTPEPKDSLRSRKDLTIIIAAVSTRTAILGGLLPEVAFTLCDAFVQKVEEIQDPELTKPMLRALQYQLTIMVKEAKERNRSTGPQLDVRVERAKAFIFAHLHEKITLADVAKDQDMNPHTLAALFRRKEGTSVGDFILEEKMRMVKGELLYTDRSYSDIATYMGYATQSHLGSVFKQHEGMTLHQFRMAFSAPARK